VLQLFTVRGKVIKAGSRLTADEVLAISSKNRWALQEAGFIELYPRPKASKHKPQTRYIIKVSDGFDVIEGHHVTPQPIGREEANRLAFSKFKLARKRPA